MAQDLAEIRNTYVSRTYYTSREMQNMLQHRSIWPAGCDIIAKKLLRKPESGLLHISTALNQHYNELLAATDAVICGRTQLCAIPKDCRNMILDNLHFVQHADYRTYKTQSIILFGKLQSLHDAPAYIHWRSPRNFTLNWYILDSPKRSSGPQCIHFDRTVRLTYTYDPHGRGEMLDLDCVRIEEDGVEKYRVTCSPDEFIAMLTEPLPQTVDEATFYPWPRSIVLTTPQIRSCSS